MKSNNRVRAACLAVIASLALGACNDPPGSGSGGGPTPISGLPNGSTLPVVSGTNVLSMTVNGMLCSAANSKGYQNKPCVSVTLCAPDGSDCQTISDVLLDTGSFGLRVFKSVLSTSLAAALTPVQVNSQDLAECVEFGDGSSDWGTVDEAEVQLGGEPAVQVPVQVIDSTFANAASVCSGADVSPSAAGFNAILGVGLFAQDCGPICAAEAGNDLYYSCTGSTSTSTCASVAVPLASQVANPVSSLPTDNNGVILELPSLAEGGAASSEGYVVLGIGTETNNAPSSVTAYPADPNVAEFQTTFDGQTYGASFIDSGSNQYYFQAPSSLSSQLPSCGSQATSEYCPSGTPEFQGTTIGVNGSPSSIVNFYVGNAVQLISGTNMVFADLAGNLGDGGQTFDWGLPFFYGRNVYVGIEGTTSSLGTGPYWAY